MSRFDLRASAIVSGIVVALLFLLLTSCSPDPRAVADGEATIIEAQIEADDAAQTREFARENQDWENSQRSERAAFWNAVEPVAQTMGRIVVVGLGIGGFAGALMLGVSAGMGAWATANAYRDFVTIRARLVYPDKRGARPLLLWEGAGERKGLLSARHVHGARWFLTDTVSGAGMVVDTSREAPATGLEIMRQSLLLGQTTAAQVESGDGQIARAIGESDFDLPDAGRVIVSTKGHEETRRLEEEVLG